MMLLGLVKWILVISAPVEGRIELKGNSNDAGTHFAQLIPSRLCGKNASTAGHCPQCSINATSVLHQSGGSHPLPRVLVLGGMFMVGKHHLPAHKIPAAKCASSPPAPMTPEPDPPSQPNVNRTSTAPPLMGRLK